MMPLFAEASPSFGRSALLAWLSARLAETVPFCLGDGLTSLSLALPAPLDVALPSGLEGAWSWTRAADGQAMLATGAALRREFPRRADLAEAVKGLAWRHVDPDHLMHEPVALLGHAFGDCDRMGLPPALLLIPALLLRRVGEHTELVLSHLGASDAKALAEEWLEALARVLEAGPPHGAAECDLERIDETPPAETFLARVETIRAAVAAGDIEKVVLSRRVRVRGPRPFDPARLAASLVARYPGCAVVTASFGPKVLVAASPERLVARHGAVVESLALAGTAPRGAAPFPDRRLLSSRKDRVEHRPVVAHVSHVLADLCEGALDIPAEPVLMDLGRIQHLATPMSGRLKAGKGLLDAAQALHPTPAIAGWPRADAINMLERLGEDRAGWYSGAMGWIDRAGDGEMVVVLRCCVLEGDEATLAAGGGIVAASDPAAELAETELKLAAILDSLKVA